MGFEPRSIATLVRSTKLRIVWRSHTWSRKKGPVGKQKSSPKQIRTAFFVELEMGFSPVATLADKQSTGLFGLSDKLLRNFLPISNPISKTKRQSKMNSDCLLVGAGNGIWTHGLLITNQLRYHCAIPAITLIFYHFLCYLSIELYNIFQMKTNPKPKTDWQISRDIV